MILVVVPSPALDKTVVLPGFQTGQTYRPAEVLTLAGGKGFNCARALRLLGQASTVVAPLGGHTGRLLRDLAEREGLACDAEEVAGEVRTCLSILDPEHAYRLTEVYEPGARLQSGEWERLVARATGHFVAASTLAICGSMPAGVPPQGLASLLTQASAASVPVVLDTYGPHLASALSAGPALLKINQFEAGELLGSDLATPVLALAGARELQRRGAREVVITLGAAGAVGLSVAGDAFGWSAPPVAALSPIGSGDSLCAGIIAGLARGQSLREALRLGVAAGAANTLQLGAGRLDLQQLDQLLPAVQPIAISA